MSISYTLDFENKYVAFLDVLGFKEMVDGNKKEKLARYYFEVSNFFSKQKSAVARPSLSKFSDAAAVACVVAFTPL